LRSTIEFFLVRWEDYEFGHDILSPQGLPFNAGQTILGLARTFQDFDSFLLYSLSSLIR
jgi:hypothetical protein